MRISISSIGSANRTGLVLSWTTLFVWWGCILQLLAVVGARRMHELVERLVAVRQIAVLGLDGLRIDNVLAAGNHDRGRAFGTRITALGIAAGDPCHVRGEHLAALHAALHEVRATFRGFHFSSESLLSKHGAQDHSSGKRISFAEDGDDIRRYDIRSRLDIEIDFVSPSRNVAMQRPGINIVLCSFSR